MDISVNKLYRALLVASAVAVWTSAAQENNSTEWTPVRFPSEDEQPSVPNISVARLAPGDEDSIIFTRDHGHTDRKDKNVKNDAKSSSLKIPIDLIHCLNSIENVTEIQKCINTDTVSSYDDAESKIGNRFGGGDEDEIGRSKFFSLILLSLSVTAD